MYRKLKNMKKAVLETWTESEAGWGQNSDGCSIHFTKEDCKNYIETYWKSMPKSTPSVYERPDSNVREVMISDKLFKRIENSDNGIRLWQSEFNSLKESNEILFKD